MEKKTKKGKEETKVKKVSKTTSRTKKTTAKEKVVTAKKKEEVKKIEKVIIKEEKVSKMDKVKKILKSTKFIICILIALIIGLIFKTKATVLRPIGTVFVNMIFVIIVPLVFINVTRSIAKINNRGKLKNIFISSLLVFVLTLFITGTLTIIFSLLVHPYSNLGIELESAEVEKINIIDKLVSMFTTNDFANLFSKSNVLPLIIFSIIMGIGINSLKNTRILESLDNIHDIIKKYLEIIMKFAPIGITCYLAALIGEYGSTFVANYLTIVLIYIGLGLFNIFFFHTIYLLIAGGKRLVKIYYKNLIRVMATAVSTQSSVITMPTNIEVFEEMELDRDLIDICTPIATITNMQGNVIENTLKIFFISSLFGIPLGGFGNYLFFILVATFAGMITAGIPGGGVISNTILVSVLGFPAEALPILITIEWLLDAPATAFNILSDTSTMPLVDKIMKEREQDVKGRN